MYDGLPVRRSSSRTTDFQSVASPSVRRTSSPSILAVEVGCRHAGTHCDGLEVRRTVDDVRRTSDSVASEHPSDRGLAESPCTASKP
jgi:hypothetical protein